MPQQPTLISTRRMPPERHVGALGVVNPPPISVESAQFTGSLGALFAVAREHKVDLLQIPFLPICEAYFAYILQAKLHDLDESASALAALAYLLERKAWALLPLPETEPQMDEMAELPSPTVYEFDAAIEALRIGQGEQEQLFFRSNESENANYELPFDLEDVTTMDLAYAFDRLLAKANPEPIHPLSGPRRSLSEMMAVVLKSMAKDFRSLLDLVPQPFTRQEAVYWFLAILELMRLGQIRARLASDDVEFALSSHS